MHLRFNKVLEAMKDEACEEAGRLRGRKRTDKDEDEGHPPKRKRRRVEADVGLLRSRRSLSADDEEERERRWRLVETEAANASGDSGGIDIEGKYWMLGLLGSGGCGSVFAGQRKADAIPVAIKRIAKDKLHCKAVDLNGKKFPTEVAIMMKLAERNGSMGTSAPVSILDWYDWGQELIVVMERPVPSINLHAYIYQTSPDEETAKEIMKQLVDAAIGLEENGVFHRDIKCDNILIETGSSVPRVRLIDFGLSCFVKKYSVYSVFYGTESYAPPEYFRDSVYRAGPSTVWQLGAVLYEMVHKKGFKTKRFLKKEVRIRSSLCKNVKDFLRLSLKGDPKLRPTLRELQLHPWLSENAAS